MRLKDQAEKVTDCFHLSYDLINVPENNCLRLKYDKEKDEELVESIIRNGQLTPIVIRKEEEKVLVVFGSRRMRALGIIREKGIPIGVDGRDTVSCIYESKINENGKFREPTSKERTFRQLGENNHVRLTHLEYGTAFKNLISDGVSIQEICTETHRSRTWVKDCIDLAEASEPIRRAVKEGRIKPTTAKKIIHADPKDRETALLQSDLGQKIKGKDIDEAKKNRVEKIKEINAEDLVDVMKKYGFVTYGSDGQEVSWNLKITIEQKDPAYIAVAVLPK
jgi:ParB-like chromosome segregation protein Spo0J